MNLRRKFNMLLASHKKPGYTPLKYIQSSGTQYIVSPVQFYGDNYKIECKFDNSDTPENTTPFGYQRQSPTTQIMVIGYNNANSTGSIFWNGTRTAHANRAKANVMTKGLNELVIEANNGTLTYTLNGARPVSYETYTSFEPQTGNMWIFGNSAAVGSGSTFESKHQLATMKFYYLRIYQNNEIKYNFISVLDSKGVPCIYDTVGKTFYYNQGTGDFTYAESINKEFYNVSVATGSVSGIGRCVTHTLNAPNRLSTIPMAAGMVGVAPTGETKDMFNNGGIATKAGDTFVLTVEDGYQTAIFLWNSDTMKSNTPSFVAGSRTFTVPAGDYDRIAIVIRKSDNSNIDVSEASFVQIEKQIYTE